MGNACSLCSKSNGTKKLHGFTICGSCESKLGLLTDDTIRRHISKYKRAAYEKELNRRLELLETDYVKKRIKLLHVISRLKRI